MAFFLWAAELESTLAEIQRGRGKKKNNQKKQRAIIRACQLVEETAVRLRDECFRVYFPPRSQIVIMLCVCTRRKLFHSACPPHPFLLLAL